MKYLLSQQFKCRTCCWQGEQKGPPDMTCVRITQPCQDCSVTSLFRGTMRPFREASCGCVSLGHPDTCRIPLLLLWRLLSAHREAGHDLAPTLPQDPRPSSGRLWGRCSPLPRGLCKSNSEGKLPIRLSIPITLCHELTPKSPGGMMRNPCPWAARELTYLQPHRTGSLWG